VVDVVNQIDLTAQQLLIRHSAADSRLATRMDEMLNGIFMDSSQEPTARNLENESTFRPVQDGPAK
jgi:hypothetical protein